MKRHPVVWFLLVWLMAGFLLQANPCAHPKRMVNGYTVNLQPLIDWWTDSKGVRPLPGWKHIRGNIARDTSSGWVVTGKAEGQSQSRAFFLKNPPREKLARFRELQRSLSQLERLRATVLEMLRRPVTTGWIWPGAGPGGATYVSAAEHRQYELRLHSIDTEISLAKEELATMQDEQGEFRLDAFALRLPETFEGLPVFDFGYPLSLGSL